MSFFIRWLKGPDKEEEEKTPQLGECLAEEDKELYDELNNFLLEEDQFEEMSVQIIKEMVSKLYKNLEVYENSQVDYVQLYFDFLATFSSHHKFLEDQLKELKDWRSSNSNLDSSPMQQVNEKEEEKHQEEEPKSQYELDNKIILDISDNLSSKKLNCQVRGINQLEELIYTRPDLVNMLLDVNKDLLSKMKVQNKVQNNKLLKYPQHFPTFSFVNLSEPSKILKLLLQLEESELPIQKIFLFKQLQSECFPLSAAHQMLANNYQDFIACPHGIMEQLKQIKQVFKISQLYTLEDLTTLTNISSKDEQEYLIHKWVTSLEQEDSFSLLLPIFFHLLKRCEKWDNIVSTMMEGLSDVVLDYQEKKVKINQKFCFLLIFLNSEVLLQIRILQLFSQFNPVPLLYRDLKAEDSYQVNDKMYYCIDNSQGVFSFALGKMASYKCGKSSLLNKVFNTNFEIEDDNLVSFGTIDIHFDHNFVPSREISIADGNGVLEKRYLEIFVNYFETLIVHLHHQEIVDVYDLPVHEEPLIHQAAIKANQNNISVQALFSQLLLTYQNQPKSIFLLIRDCPEPTMKSVILQDESLIFQMFPSLEQTKTILEAKKMNLNIICLKNMTELPQEQRQNIFNQIRKAIYTSMFQPNFQLPQQKFKPSSMKQVEEEKEELNQSMETSRERFNVCTDSFAELLLNLDPQNEIITVHRKSKEFIINLLKFQEDFYNEKAFPSRNLMKTLRSCENDLKTSTLTESKMLQSEQLKGEVEKKLSSIVMTQCIQDFMEVLSLEQSMVALIEISRILKLSVERNIKHLLSEKTQLYQQSKGQADQNLNAQIDNINLLIDKYRLSMEHIWREVFYMYEYNKRNFVDFKISPKDQIRNSILAGEPFELIDGDNLYFSKDMISDILNTSQLNKSRVLIITILGPQSSGKSTLLNYMFGCLFATSAGRCTKGIYGSIITLKDNPSYDKIFIIDSEGLLSSEKNDNEFDRKITCFALAVSHIVLINVKGDLHLPMQNLLEICTLNLHELNKDKIEMPLVYFVFNQNTDLEKTKFMGQIDNIYNNIINANEFAKETAQIFKPDENLIKPLPLAYKLERIEKSTKNGIPSDWDFKEPSSNFSNACSTFCSEILQEIKNRNQGDKALNSRQFSEWLKLSHGIWETIEKYPDLIIYSNIQSMKQDKILKSLIEQIQKDYLIDVQKDHKAYQTQIFNTKKAEIESLQQVQNLGGGFWEKIMFDLEKEMQDYFKDIKTRIENELEQVHNNENFDPILYKKHKLFLLNRVDMFYQEAIIELNRNLLSLRFDKTSKTGLYDLREKLVKLVKGNQEKGVEPQEHDFSSTWNEFLDKQIKDINIEKNNTELFWKIVELYSNKTNKIPNKKIVKEHMQKVLKQSSNFDFSPSALFQHQDDDLLQFFCSEFQGCFNHYKTMQIPKFEQIPKNIQTNKHNYINAKDFLNRQYYFIIFDISKLLDLFYDKILTNLQDKILQKIHTCSTQFKTTEAKRKLLLKDELIKIALELSLFGVEISGDFMKSLYGIIEENNFKSGLLYGKSIHELVEQSFTNRSSIQQPLVENRVLLPNSTLIQYFDIKSLQDQLFDYTKHENLAHLHILRYLEGNSKEEIENYQHFEMKNIPMVYISKCHLKYQPKEQFKELERFLTWIQRPSERGISAKKMTQQGIEFCMKYTHWLQYFKILALELRNQIQIDQNTSIDEENWKNISSLCVSIIDNSFQKVQLSIENLNYELEQFAISLQIEAETSIHLYSIYIIYKVLGQATQQRLLSPIKSLDNRREEWYNIFLSLTAYNPKSLSQAVGRGVCQNLENRCNFELINMISEQAKQIIQQNASQFTVSSFVTQLDEVYFQRCNDIEQTIGYILNQFECYEKNFHLLWGNVKSQIDQVIEKEKKHVLSMIKDLIQMLQVFKQFLTDHNLINLEAIQLFEGNSSIDEEIESRQMAAYQFLGLLLSKQPIENKEFITDKGIISVAKTYSILNFANTKANITQSEIVINSYYEIEMKQIGNFKILLDIMVDKLEQMVIDFSNKSFTEVEIGIDSKMHELKKSSIGCLKTCPCCGRKCEQESADHQDNHEIFQGHQIQGMKGIRYEGSNVALTESCDERKPSDECKFDGQRITWIKYIQTMMKDWTIDFNQNQQVKVNNHEKFRQIWKKLGPEICTFYKTKHDIPIEFNSIISAGSQKHFILILDDSGSMSGKGWTNAVKGVESFLQIGEQNFKTDTVSLIQFSTQAVISCEYKQMSQNLASTLKYRSGGTEFGPPLVLALDLMRTYSSKCDIHIIIFYTDGGANYPANEVSQMKNSGLQFRFFAICEGSGTGAFSQMTSDLGGKLVPQVTPDMLTTQLVAVLNSFNRS